MRLKALRSFVKEFNNDERGEGYIDVLIKILITVVIGTILMKLLELAVPDLFDGIIAKIRTFLVI